MLMRANADTFLMTIDPRRKVLIPLGKYDGLKRVGNKFVPANEDDIDETPHGFDVATLDLNGTSLAFPEEYDETFEYVFTCPPLDTVNAWIHEDEEHSELRAMTINDLREKKLLFAVSQDSIGDGLLAQIYIQVAEHSLLPEDQPQGWADGSPPMHLLRFGTMKVAVTDSTLQILNDYYAGNHDPLSKVCDKIAKRMKMSHMTVEDYFASDLPLLVKSKGVTVNMHEGVGAPNLSPAEKAALRELDEAYRAQQQAAIEQQYGKEAKTFKED